MPAEIFRGRVQDQVGAEIERPLQHWRPGVVANQKRSGIVYDFRDGSEIDNFQQRIGRRLCPRQLCVWLQRFFHGGQIVHVHEIGFESPAQKNLTDQSRRSVRGVHVRQDVVARRKRLKDRHGCSRSGAECRGRGTAFQRAYPALQCLPVGIVVARVHEPARVRSVYVAFERRGQINRGGDCSGRRVNAVPGVNS